MQNDLGLGDTHPDKDDAIAGALVEHELDASDPSEQRTRAILQLFRWLAIGKTIAVVGSGASVVYGYPDWKELVDEICKLFETSNYKPTENAERNFNSLIQTLRDDQQRRGAPPKKEPKPGPEHNPLLNRDEQLALCDALAMCLTKEDRSKYETSVAKLFSRSNRYYRRSDLLMNHPLGDQLQALLSGLPLLDERDSPKASDLIPADIVELVDSLPIDGCPELKPATSGKNELINAPRNLLDPLSELRSRIGIHRFVTFNYDLEIEALLEDIDYPYDELTRTVKTEDLIADKADKPDRTSESRIGGAAHSISLSPENAPDLITIAAVPSSANDLVVHVHGAATRPSDMVLTPSNYNAMYYDEHPFRRGFEDARRLLFGGNAVLYIGFGLSEEDAMRPLRYLSANLKNRPLFALMPLLSNENRARAFELKIKTNYGVNVITYGRGFSEIPGIWKQNNTPHPLSHIDKKFISLGAELQNLRESFLPADGETVSKDRLRKGLENLRDNSKSFPRLHHGNAIARELAKILLEEILRSPAKLQPKKAEAFVKKLSAMATTIALNNAVEYMQSVTRGWQTQLHLWPPPGTDYAPEIGKHYGAVHRVALAPDTPGLSDKSDVNKIGNLLPSTKASTGVRIVLIESGKGRGTYFTLLKKHAESKHDWRAISLGYTMRGTTVLSDVLAKLNNIRVLCLQDADCLLAHSHPQPATLFLAKFLSALREKSLSSAKKAGLHLILIVRSRRSAEIFAKFFEEKPGKPQIISPLQIHSAEHLKQIGGERWAQFSNKYGRLAEAMTQSRWAFLAMNGAYQNLEGVRGLKGFLEICNYSLDGRLFSIDKKHHQAALCEVLLEERHRLIQRSMDIDKRNQIIVENIILKWMYAIPIPIDWITVQNIPEIKKLKEDVSLGHRVDDSTIANALSALKIYRFIFEIEYDINTLQPSEKSRYILHSAMRQLLGYRRGFSLDAPLARDQNSVCLSLMLMDGGPMLSAEDFASTCDLFDKLIALTPTQENRVAIRSAYALIRATIHTQSAMRAGLVAEPIDYSRSALHAHLRRLARLRSLSRRNHVIVEDPPAPRPALYAEDELWLLNELGVVRYLQGNMHDAVFALRECMGAAERIKIGGRSMADIDPSLRPRLSINLALCLIERARFHDADSLVSKALHGLLAQGKDAENPEYLLLLALLLGCRAQIQLLTAQLDSARATVKDAIPIIEKLGALGAQAWLHSVEASAALAREAHEDADKAISLALAAARGAHRPDLVLSLELSAIDIELSTSGYNRETVFVSLTRLENLERSALRLGSHRSRCAAMLIRGRALLTIAQMEPARETIIEAISIAQLNGMRLKRISGLILLVALMAQRGEHEPARRLLQSVKLAANRARYVRAVADIERLQQAMEIEGGVPQWAGFVSDFGSTDRRRSTLR
ncbi:MAG: SIR2 family protein [Xanthomonadales bacterium]|nr:SIR2 family protein [Xanthomonadales bacterium]